MNQLGKQKKPFLFLVDFKMEHPQVFLPEDPEILFDIEGFRNFPPPDQRKFAAEFTCSPPSFESYLFRFNQVQQEIHNGNSYLLNLTVPTPVITNLSLSDIFFYSKARYKLLYKDLFVVFSPEIFIRITGNRIFSYPMKGTIDAAIADAEEKILNDKKEIAEHYTIVDLIRNDLSMVATNVKVERFRYIDHLSTNNKNLLQVSSEISGLLEPDFASRIGDILFRLLPAGSVTGAPKEKTVEIITRVEGYERGYYTGVFGMFDGENLNSGVMIRFIEKRGEQMIYKSGGGITSFSNAESEYQEMIDKIYVPVF